MTADNTPLLYTVFSNGRWYTSLHRCSVARIGFTSATDTCLAFRIPVSNHVVGSVANVVSSPVSDALSASVTIVSSTVVLAVQCSVAYVPVSIPSCRAIA